MKRLLHITILTLGCCVFVSGCRIMLEDTLDHIFMSLRPKGTSLEPGISKKERRARQEEEQFDKWRREFDKPKPLPQVIY